MEEIAGKKLVFCFFRTPSDLSLRTVNRGQTTLITKGAIPPMKLRQEPSLRNLVRAEVE
jgi:hypothetical protein